jgi:hypothetical protein
MKKITCPRCDGTGEIEENETLIGLSPFQDRPSTVDDDEWSKTQPRGDGEPTAIAPVPIFRIPERLKKKGPLTIRELAEMNRRPSRWVRWVVVAFVLGGLGGLGFVQRRTVAIYSKYLTNRYKHVPEVASDE